VIGEVNTNLYALHGLSADKREDTDQVRSNIFSNITSNKVETKIMGDLTCSNKGLYCVI
jgi:hypothetical protein